jgi:flagellar L-ring protein precursor FlgH
MPRLPSPASETVRRPAARPGRRIARRSQQYLSGLSILIGAIGLLALAGCQSVPTRDPNFAPARPVAQAPMPDRRGAIYPGGQDLAVAEVDFFSDIRPRRVGDSLTVILVERTNASKSNDASVDKQVDMTVANPTLFGTQPNFRLPNRNTTFTLEQQLNSDKQFEGKGEANQSNSLTGQITVTVVEVLPNGNLAVQGEKILTLNRGHEHVRLSGIVRPMDIGPDNTIPSNRVADATIVYSGEGEVADASVMGWLARFFVSALMPF